MHEHAVIVERRVAELICVCHVRNHVVLTCKGHALSSVQSSRMIRRRVFETGFAVSLKPFSDETVVNLPSDVFCVSGRLVERF